MKILVYVVSALIGGVLTGLLVSCTISFQNIDTHGTATDLVDENQTTSPTVSPNIEVPAP